MDQPLCHRDAGKYDQTSNPFLLVIDMQPRKREDPRVAWCPIWGDDALGSGVIEHITQIHTL